MVTEQELRDRIKWLEDFSQQNADKPKAAAQIAAQIAALRWVLSGSDEPTLHVEGERR